MINVELIINIVVIILLIAVILYIWKLNRNLSILKSKYESLQNLAFSLNAASDKAAGVINTLKSTATDVSSNIENAIEKAKYAEETLLQTVRTNTDSLYSTNTPQNRLNKNIKKSPVKIFEEENNEEKSETEIELLKALRSIR